MCKAKELFKPADYEMFTRQQRAHILKIENAKEASEIRKFSSAVCDVVFDQIPEDMKHEMNYHELGKVANLVLKSYLNGMQAQKYHTQRMLQV